MADNLKSNSGTAEARSMGYQAVALGAGDLKMTASELLAGANSADGSSIFIGSNIALLALADLAPQVKVVADGGIKIGVTSVLADDYVAKLTDSDLVSESAEQGLTEATNVLKKAGCNMHVLWPMLPLKSRSGWRRVPDL
ncbi:MAG: hypothetical protein U0894_19115 [Pirellulales bacterium]